MTLALTTCIYVFARSNPKLIKQYTGELKNSSMNVHISQFITDTETLIDAWETLDISGKVPKIDFNKQLVVVSTWKGSSFTPSYYVDRNGDLKTTILGTLDLRSGLQYALAIFDREGIKTVQGKSYKSIIAEYWPTDEERQRKLEELEKQVEESQRNIEELERKRDELESQVKDFQGTRER